ncbi:hypothetical protein FQR65_LT19177 [Abscondita terminalis]|nr:hypothetical protein FQR65_LT19177 [Abscondita terminalis]
MESPVKNIFDIDIFGTPNARGIYHDDLPYCEAALQCLNESKDHESDIEIITISTEDNHEEEPTNVLCEDASANEIVFNEELPEGFMEVMDFIDDLFNV